MGGVGVGFLTTLGVGVGFFCLTPTLEVQLYHIYITLVGNACGNGTISYETFVETEISCCVPRYPLGVSCYKIIDSQTSFILC